ncbi:MAG: xylulokinase [Phycisphaerales bacterium]|nr:xylulokinase [Phycisphaerales bacterium]
MHLMGIDIGTTGTRTLVVDLSGRLVASAVETYGLSTPRPLWSEQDPGDWWTATIRTIRIVLETVPAESIQAIGLSGQMHGLVLLDEQGVVLRPAILWNDQRTSEQCEWITRRVGRDALMMETCNPVLTGFTAGKILWVRDHERTVFDRARRILLPKDYVRFKLSGGFATDVSDASGTSLFNVHRRRWSDILLSSLALEPALFPEVLESSGLSGAVSKEAAEITGLKPGTRIVAGAGDQAAGAVGAGVVQRGIVSVSLGTSGVVFAHAESPATDPLLRTHTFCHAVPDKWHLMGVMLSAGGSLRWWRDALCGEEVAAARQRGTDAYELIAASAAKVPAGAEGLLFLPYLTGERTPHADPLARGAFVGLTLRTGKAHMARAVMEGVAYALNDSLSILKDLHVPIEEIRITGGGARSSVWRQMIADVFQRPLVSLAVDEGPAWGAALLAGTGCGAYPSVPDACRRCVRTAGVTEPNRAHAGVYQHGCQRFRELYPNLKEDFAAADLSRK